MQSIVGYFLYCSEMAASSNYLYIDCTSNGLGKLPPVPIFNGKNICLQPIVQCQQVYSAAALGALEARFSDNDEVVNIIDLNCKCCRALSINRKELSVC